jgi:hypothetical protein
MLLLERLIQSLTGPASHRSTFAALDLPQTYPEDGAGLCHLRQRGAVPDDGLYHHRQ